VVNVAKKTWYLCSECGYTRLTEDEAYTQHARWGHIIKKRTPPHMRMVYSLGDERNFTLDVDGSEWTIVLRLLSFKRDKPERGSKTEKWRYFSSSILGGNLTEISKKLSCLRPEITESELTELVRDTIRKGRFDEYGKQRVGINVCLDSDLQLEPKNPKSRWITTTSSQLRALIKGESESTDEAYQIAQKTKLG